MPRIVLVALALVLALAGVTAAGEAEIADIPWGSPEAVVRQRLEERLHECYGQPAETRACLVTVSIGGVPDVPGHLYFRAGRMVGWKLFLDRGILETLAGRYGQPRTQASGTATWRSRDAEVTHSAFADGRYVVTALTHTEIAVRGFPAK
jgi:hypothetical protein